MLVKPFWLVWYFQQGINYLLKTLLGTEVYSREPYETNPLFDLALPTQPFLLTDIIRYVISILFITHSLFETRFYLSKAWHMSENICILVYKNTKFYKWRVTKSDVKSLQFWFHIKKSYSKSSSFSFLSLYILIFVLLLVNKCSMAFLFYQKISLLFVKNALCVNTIPINFTT